jgi:hypothetical protein
MLDMLSRWVGGCGAYGVESIFVRGRGFGALFGEGLLEHNIVSLDCREKERDAHGHGCNADMQSRGA